jgi:hypothetical protein
MWFRCAYFILFTATYGDGESVAASLVGHGAISGGTPILCPGRRAERTGTQDSTRRLASAGFFR